jgi:hypothetical protein
MDIHRPKAAHSIREFLIEIGTIICGILIALSLEQVVEALRHQTEAREARETIRTEIEGDLSQMLIRQRYDDCTAARLGEIETLIRDWRAKQQLKAALWIGRPTTWELRFSAYQSASNTGRTALFPAHEQATYAAVYAHLRTFLDAQERERPAWARLQALPRYNPALEADLLMALQEAKYDRARAASAIRQTLRDAGPLKLEPNTAGPMRVMGKAPACIPLHTERGRALELFYGNGDRSAEP